jgi:hypothetical protein
MERFPIKGRNLFQTIISPNLPIVKPQTSYLSNRYISNQAIFLSQNQAKMFKRFVKYPDIREKGLEMFYIILGELGSLLNTPALGGSPIRGYSNLKPLYPNLSILII